MLNAQVDRADLTLRFRRMQREALRLLPPAPPGDGMAVAGGGATPAAAVGAAPPPPLLTAHFTPALNAVNGLLGTTAEAAVDPSTGGVLRGADAAAALAAAIPDADPRLLPALRAAPPAAAGSAAAAIGGAPTAAHYTVDAAAAGITSPEAAAAVADASAATGWTLADDALLAAAVRWHGASGWAASVAAASAAGASASASAATVATATAASKGGPSKGGGGVSGGTPPRGPAALAMGTHHVGSRGGTAGGSRNSDAVRIRGAPGRPRANAAGRGP